MYDKEYLMHFNPNHDPRTGRFAKSSSGTQKNSVVKKINRMTVKQKAAAAAGTMALVSAGMTFVNYQFTNGLLEGMGESVRISPLSAVGAGTIKAGKVAAATGLAVIGGHMISDYMKQNKSSDKKR